MYICQEGLDANIVDIKIFLPGVDNLSQGVCLPRERLINFNMKRDFCQGILNTFGFALDPIG